MAGAVARMRLPRAGVEVWDPSFHDPHMELTTGFGLGSTGVGPC